MCPSVQTVFELGSHRKSFKKSEETLKKIKQVERGSTSPVVKEIKMKVTMVSYFSFIREAIMKTKQNKTHSACNYALERALLHIISGNVTSYYIFGKLTSC